ncbi:MAG TPA: hypothetical protein VHP57_11120, partial [Acidimicrobiia bacterium]|nr:hypothetical protein [Acidimicrobiia bacterium]
MTAAWFLAKADLRQRWRSWVVLGLLAGVTIGLAAAGVAGARRTADALPRYEAASGSLDAAVLPNNPAFDAKQRAQVAALPEVRQTLPFQVPFLLNVVQPKGLEGALLPVTPASMRELAGVVIEGRKPDAAHADEIVVDENIRRRFRLGLGSTMVVGQSESAQEAQLPPGLAPAGDFRFRARLRVVGITKSTSSEINWTPSSAFYDRYRSKLAGPINMFVGLD